jgi:hypothetical protein
MKNKLEDFGDKDDSGKFSTEKAFNHLKGINLSAHTFEQIGTYTVWDNATFDKMFPVLFGRFKQEERDVHGISGLMCKEEAVRLTADLARRCLKKHRDINFEHLLTLTTAQVKADFLNNTKYFTQIFQEFADSLLDILHKNEDEKVKTLFLGQSLFDSFVTIMVKSLEKKPMRVHLAFKETREVVFKQLIEILVQQMEKENCKPMTIDPLLVHLPHATILLEKSRLPNQHQDYIKSDTTQFKLYLRDFQQLCFHHWQPTPMRSTLNQGYRGFNSGAFLWGKTGAGKSGIQAYVSAWA